MAACPALKELFFITLNVLASALQAFSLILFNVFVAVGLSFACFIGDKTFLNLGSDLFGSSLLYIVQRMQRTFFLRLHQLL